MIGYMKKLVVIVITVAWTISLLGVIAQSKNFTIKDVLKTDESYENIQWVLNQGYMSLASGKFMPNSKVRRNEFSVILSKINGDSKNLDKPTKAFFLDVGLKDQFFRYIESEKEYITYYKSSKGNLFKPLTYITREDAAMSTVKILGYDTDDAVAENVNSEMVLEDMIMDANKVSPALKKYVSLVVQNELIDLRENEDNIYFDPKNSISRKELANLIFNAYQNKDLNKSDEITKTVIPEDNNSLSSKTNNTANSTNNKTDNTNSSTITNSSNASAVTKDQKSEGELLLKLYKPYKRKWTTNMNPMVMGGKTYSDGKNFNIGFSMNNGDSSENENWGAVYFNIEGKYKTLEGIVGFDDKSPKSDIPSFNEGDNDIRTICFYGDDKLLGKYVIKEGDLPKNFNIDLTGVSQLFIREIETVFLPFEVGPQIDFVNVIIK